MARTKDAVNFTLSHKTLDLLADVRTLRRERDILAGIKHSRNDERVTYGSSSIADDLLLKAGLIEVSDLRKEIELLKKDGSSVEVKTDATEDRFMRNLLFNWSDKAKGWSPLSGGGGEGL